MCKKLIFLISFVFVLSLGINAFALDLEPPEFAGADGSGATLWEFDIDPVPGEDLWDPEGEGPTTWCYEPALEEYGFSVWPSFGEVLWDEEGQLLTIDEDETGFYMPIPEGEGDFVTLYVQIHTSEIFEIYPMLEGWTDPGRFGDYMGGAEGEDLDFWGEPVDLGDGTFHTVFYHTFNPPGDFWDEIPPFVNVLFWWFEIEVYEVILDAVIHDGDPPAGPGHCFGGFKPSVTVLAPDCGAGHLDPAATEDVNLVFEAPGSALCIDINASPNMCGPFEYKVYFGTDPCKPTMTVLADGLTTTECNDVVEIDPTIVFGALSVGTTYYWYVDFNDANDCTTYGGAAGTQVDYNDTQLCSFTTWGFVLEPNSIPCGVGDVDPAGAIEWAFDGYASCGNVYFDNMVDPCLSCTTLTTYDPPGDLDLGTEYCWRVDEVDGAGAIEGVECCFETAFCASVETWESYTDATVAATWLDYTTYDTGAGEYTDALVYINGEGESGPGGGFDSDQSLDIFYSNGFEGFAETKRVYGTAKDLTQSGTAALRLWIRGDGKALWTSGSDPVIAIGLKDGGDNVDYQYYDDYGGDEDFPDANSIISDPCDWHLWEISLADFTGVDETDVKEIRISVGDPDNPDVDFGISGDLYVDLLERCAPYCRPAITNVADIAWDDCIVNAADLGVVIGVWQSFDFDIIPTEPCDANLIVEYLFDSDLSDTSGNGNTGVALGTATVGGGVLTLENIGDPCSAFFDEGNAVVVPIDGRYFAGVDQAVTVAFDVNVFDVGIVFGVARKPWAGEEDPCDPCDPNSMTLGDTHSLAVFAREGEEALEIGADRFWMGEAFGEFEEGFSVNFAVVYDPELEGEEDVITATVYINGYEAAVMEAGDPNVPEGEDDIILIGHSVNWIFPGVDIELGGLNGEVDNFRIYDIALSQEEVIYLMQGDATPFPIPVDEVANLDVDGGAWPAEVIDILDYIVIADNWEVEELWP